VTLALLIAKPNSGILSASVALSVLGVLGSIFTMLSFDFPRRPLARWRASAAIGLLNALLGLAAQTP